MSPERMLVDVPCAAERVPRVDSVLTPVSTQELVESEVLTLPTLFVFDLQRSLTSDDCKNNENPSVQSIELKNSTLIATEQTSAKKGRYPPNRPHQTQLWTSEV